MLTVNRPTALGLSIALHASLLLVGFIAWPWAAHREPIHITPVTLMTSAEIATLRAADEAPAPQEAQVDKPEPAPAKEQPTPPKAKPPEPKPPAPIPPPKPAKPEPAPKPVVKPVAAPAKPPAKPTPPSRSLDLNSLAQSLAKAAPPAPPAPPPKTVARAGPTQEELAAQARQAEGEARAALNNALSAIAAKIADNWNVACSNPDDRKIVVVLRIDLGLGGGLIAVKPDKYDRVEEIPDPRLRAAALSAASAARAAAPFTGLPQQSFNEWRSKTYEFRASEVCADRMRGR